MPATNDFELLDFLPYLFNQTADVLSLEFQQYYRGTYGMLRTEWRVLFHLGCYGEMTAKEICDRARVHKTKVSRAVAALEKKRFLARRELTTDRRHELLSLTKQGQRAFADLDRAARDFDAKLRAEMTPEEAEILYRCLIRISGLSGKRSAAVSSV